MDLDIQKLQTRVTEIQENVAKIKKLTKLNDHDLFSGEHNVAAIKYYLIVILEAVGSICVHVCAKRLQKAVGEYADCFDHLREGGIVSKELGEELIKMARFRNRLVHRYWDNDDHKIIEYAREDIKTVEKFVKAIGKLI